MKRILTTLVTLVLMTTLSVTAQTERRLLSIEDVVLNRDLTPKSYPVRWVGASDSYATVEQNALIAYDARTAKKRTLITVEELNQLLATNFKTMPAYSFEEDGSLVVTAHNQRTVIDLKTKQITSRSQIPTGGENLTRQSGKGGLYAYTKKNNLYLFDGQKEIAVTSYDDPNIVCGQTVSRNEFGISGGIFFSPDATKLAFYRKDESHVTDFPLLDIQTRTGELKSIKYPMNGMASEHVSLGVYDIATGKTIYLNVTDFDEERYLTNITWSPDSQRIYIQVLDRAQHNVHLNSYSASTGQMLKQILTEHNDRWVEPQHPLVFLESDPTRFIYATDNRDGYWNLYLCNDEGQIERLTKTDASVAYVAQDAKHVYYTSAEVSPIDNHLFRVEIATGKQTRLTKAEGWHTVAVSKSGRYFLDTYSSLHIPRVVELGRTDLKPARELFRAEDPTADYNYSEITIGTVKSADGKYDNYYRLIKPLDFDPTKKYPVILYVYGGPHSQMVQNTYLAQLRRWEMYMAQRGYVVFVMDNRGTSNRGAEFEKAINRQCGQAEMADQMEGMKWLMSHEWVDKDRIGVHGWSYGGFMTISLITNYPDVFKVGVAGGPVIDWKWYEIMYGERYMDNTQNNPEGFELTSLINKATNLKGKLLICQGAVDNVVVWQHSLSFVQECVRNNIHSIDYMPYPTAEHNVYGRDALHLYNKITNYFEDYLR
ncbi:MAG: DPP IV N-terminal domain-containing protein [Alistipes sp.]|nr:DPP IV N-terminal domain-containing protein [Alistipes sp.]MBP3600915.1 DPP IV N-terminal domain-containing protein [Alistipes sp.]